MLDGKVLIALSASVARLTRGALCAQMNYVCQVNFAHRATRRSRTDAFKKPSALNAFNGSRQELHQTNIVT